MKKKGECIMGEVRNINKLVQVDDGLVAFAQKELSKNQNQDVDMGSRLSIQTLAKKIITKAKDNKWGER